MVGPKNRSSQISTSVKHAMEDNGFSVCEQDEARQKGT